MKRVVCLVVIMSAALFAQEKNPVTAAAHEIAAARGKNLVAAAEEMPADKYDYRPTPAQVTFGHMVMHTARSNYFLCSKISGAEAPKSDIKETDSKDKLVTALKDSVSYCDLALTKSNDSHLDEMFTVFRRAQVVARRTSDRAMQRSGRPLRHGGDVPAPERIAAAHGKKKE